MASSPSCASKLIRDSLGVVDYLGHWLGVYLSDGSTRSYVSFQITFILEYHSQGRRDQFGADGRLDLCDGLRNGPTSRQTLFVACFRPAHTMLVAVSVTVCNSVLTCVSVTFDTAVSVAVLSGSA